MVTPASNPHHSDKQISKELSPSIAVFRGIQRQCVWSQGQRLVLFRLDESLVNELPEVGEPIEILSQVIGRIDKVLKIADDCVSCSVNITLWLNDAAVKI